MRSASPKVDCPDNDCWTTESDNEGRRLRVIVVCWCSDSAVSSRRIRRRKANRYFLLVPRLEDVSDCAFSGALLDAIGDTNWCVIYALFLSQWPCLPRHSIYFLSFACLSTTSYAFIRIVQIRNPQSAKVDRRLTETGHRKKKPFF